jgi:hypothetical protein
MVFDFVHLISILELLVIGIMIFASRSNKKEKLLLDKIIIKQNVNYLQTLKNTIYGNSPILERLIAFKEYIKCGGNGNCKNFAITNLIISNRELWLSVLNNDSIDEIDKSKNAYLKTLSEIDNKIL